MLTLVVVADTRYQYQAFIRRWFEQLRSAAAMDKHFMWVAPRDESVRFKLECTRGGLYFVVSAPDKVLQGWLIANNFHRAEMQEKH